ncbi:MAG: prephenate dehydrogenase [Oscillospiraceae bacterium]|nr:prephenate dehydrogenase [Oscillospiraceae bacterium]
MKAGIVGLGLIGGSLAKAYAENENVTVYGCDTDASTIAFAKLAGVIADELNEETAPLCDIILIAVPPVAAVRWLEGMAPHLNENNLVVDCCGTKRVVCNACFPLAEKYGFTFVGGHPMAGTQYAGFKNSKVDMFKGERMVIVPPRFDDIRLLDKVKKLLEPVGFGTFSISTADIHDETIAFTSQMAHVISNSFIKSPTAGQHKGVSAGSYKDLTRVANLNPDMWSELFLENGDRLLFELDTFITEISKYRDAIRNNDRETLRALLAEGARRKKEVDG